MGCNLRCAGNRDDLYVTAGPIEEPTGDSRKNGGDPAADDLVHSFDPTVFPRGNDESAATKIEVQAHLEIPLGLADEIPAGDTSIGGAIGDELRYVLRANEYRFEFAAEGRGERTVSSSTNWQTGVLEQLTGLVRKTPFVRQGDPQHGSSRLVGIGVEKMKTARRWTGRGVSGVRTRRRLAAHPVTRKSPARRSWQ